MNRGYNVTGSGRRKVGLQPGFSQMHWMRLSQSGKDLSGLRGKPPRRDITMDEVRQHNSEEDCWSVFEGKVYNITPYLHFHPGGASELMRGAGGDMTNLFNEKHPWVNGHSMLEKCYIGKLDPTSLETIEASGKAREGPTVALDKSEWRPFKLTSKENITPSTIKFTFELPKSCTLGLEMAGQHLDIRANMDGAIIERPYTPTSKLNQLNFFTLLVKVYPDGKLTPYLASLEPGAMVEMRGPKGSLGYPSTGILSSKPSAKTTVQDPVKHLVMIAAGSGITPMLQLIRHICENHPKDPTKITLLDCNHDESEVMAKDMLEPLPNFYPNQVQVHHILSDCPESTDLSSVHQGRLSASILQELLPKETRGVGVLYCGPEDFELFVREALLSLDYKSKQLYHF